MYHMFKIGPEAYTDSHVFKHTCELAATNVDMYKSSQADVCTTDLLVNASARFNLKNT